MNQELKIEHYLVETRLGSFIRDGNLGFLEDEEFVEYLKKFEITGRSDIIISTQFCHEPLRLDGD